jgi:cadmium resistance transport/sequestration family protein
LRLLPAGLGGADAPPPRTVNPVGDLLGTIGAAIGVFVGTDIDDLVILTVLFLSARADGRPRPWQIWLGQYAGIGVLLLVSALGALGLTLVPDRWVGLLGLIPIGMGLYGLVGAIRGDDDGGGGGERPATATGALAVAGITVANGADNIAVYTPMFRTIGLGDSAIVVLVFAVLIAAWCAVASWLGSHRAVVAVVERFGHWIVPGVFITIGVVILAGSGVVGELL